MRFLFLSLDFALLLLVMVALVQGGKPLQFRVQCGEQCQPENCVTADKCEDLHKARLPCEIPGTVCCSVVKVEDRNLCRQWGGECMDKCNPTISKTTDDCKAPQKCCVLV